MKNREKTIFFIGDIKMTLDQSKGRRGCSTRTMRRWFIVGSLVSATFIATALFYDPQYLERLARRVKIDNTVEPTTRRPGFGADGKQHVFGFPFYQIEGRDAANGEDVVSPTVNATRKELGQILGDDTNTQDGQMYKDLGESETQVAQETAVASEEGLMSAGRSLQPGDNGYRPSGSAAVQQPGSVGQAPGRPGGQLTGGALPGHMPDLGGAPGAGQMVSETGIRNDMTSSQGRPPYVPNVAPGFQIPQIGQQNIPGQVSGVGPRQGQIQPNAAIQFGTQQGGSVGHIGPQGAAPFVPGQTAPASTATGSLSGSPAAMQPGLPQQNPQSTSNTAQGLVGKPSVSVQTLGQNMQEMRQRAMIGLIQGQPTNTGQAPGMQPPGQPSATGPGRGQSQPSAVGPGQGQGQPSAVGPGQGQGQPSAIGPGQGQSSAIGPGQGQSQSSMMSPGQASASQGQAQLSNIGQSQQSQGQGRLLKRALSMR